MDTQAVLSTKEELLRLLKLAYDEGLNGYEDLKDTAVSHLLESFLENHQTIEIQDEKEKEESGGEYISPLAHQPDTSAGIFGAMAEANRPLNRPRARRIADILPSSHHEASSHHEGLYPQAPAEPVSSGYSGYIESPPPNRKHRRKHKNSVATTATTPNADDAADLGNGVVDLVRSLRSTRSIAQTKIQIREMTSGMDRALALRNLAEMGNSEEINEIKTILREIDHPKSRKRKLDSLKEFF